MNAVAFADDSSHILFSGGDDGLCKVRNEPKISVSNSFTVEATFDIEI